MAITITCQSTQNCSLTGLSSSPMLDFFSNLQLFIAVFGIAFMIPLIIINILLLNGYGAFFIAGFNTMSKKRQSEYNKPLLCRFIGLILLPINTCTVGIFVAIFFEIYILIWICTAIIVGFSIFTAIYIRKDKFKL